MSSELPFSQVRKSSQIDENTRNSEFTSIYGKLQCVFFLGKITKYRIIYFRFSSEINQSWSRYNFLFMAIMHVLGSFQHVIFAMFCHADQSTPIPRWSKLRMSRDQTAIKLAVISTHRSRRIYLSLEPEWVSQLSIAWCYSIYSISIIQ